MSDVVLWEGDVLAVLSQFEPSSIDGCLCDPPYGIDFMGAAWDRGVPSVAVWREVLRVLKPGATLLAFGGTRTFHRLACAIEDSGFELFDSILATTWLYGQGFPKSIDISEQIDRRRDWGALRELAAKVAAARRALGISQSDAAARCGFIPAGAQLGGGGYMWFETGRVPNRDEYLAIKAGLELDDACDDAFEAAEREPVASRNVGRLAVAPGQGEDRGTRDLAITAPASEAAALWEGYGTALKPAWEPVVGARRPLTGTYAANALQHGVGGFAIDSCRIGGAQQPDGRWPANLVLSHHPACVETGTRSIRTSTHYPAQRGIGGIATSGHGGQDDLEERRPAEEVVDAWQCHPDCPVAELDRQSGVLHSGYMAPGQQRQASAGGGGYHGGFPDQATAAGTYGDTGGASRFFYAAKVGPGERGNCKHPTLKPIDLARYLAALILPPPRKSGARHLLVPYSGAGSEIIGALRAGWDLVSGVENDPAWITDAERRICADAPLFNRVRLICRFGRDVPA